VTLGDHSYSRESSYYSKGNDIQDARKSRQTPEVSPDIDRYCICVCVRLCLCVCLWLATALAIIHSQKNVDRLCCGRGWSDMNSWCIWQLSNLYNDQQNGVLIFSVLFIPLSRSLAWQILRTSDQTPPDNLISEEQQDRLLQR
jgi:hypothetical protein